MNIKKLKIPDYIKYSVHNQKLIDTLIPFDPPFKFGKEGFYCYDNVAWFETENGLCYLQNKNKFNAELLQIDAYHLTKEQKLAIRQFVKFSPKKFITKELLDYYWAIEFTEQFFSIRNRLQSYKMHKQIMQKFKKTK